MTNQKNDAYDKLLDYLENTQAVLRLISAAHEPFATMEDINRTARMVDSISPDPQALLRKAAGGAS